MSDPTVANDDSSRDEEVAALDAEQPALSAEIHDDAKVAAVAQDAAVPDLPSGTYQLGAPLIQKMQADREPVYFEPKVKVSSSTARWVAGGLVGTLFLLSMLLWSCGGDKKTSLDEAYGQVRQAHKMLTESVEQLASEPDPAKVKGKALDLISTVGYVKSDVARMGMSDSKTQLVNAALDGQREFALAVRNVIDQPSKQNTNAATLKTAQAKAESAWSAAGASGLETASADKLLVYNKTVAEKLALQKRDAAREARKQRKAKGKSSSSKKSTSGNGNATTTSTTATTETSTTTTGATTTGKSGGSGEAAKSEVLKP